MEEISENYVSLNTHSSWSLGQALSTPKQLFDKAKEIGSKAVCVTDYDTMAGMWDCLKLSRETGIKFIAGCEFNFVEDLENQDDTRLTKIVLIAKNGKGYSNMLALRKHGFDHAYTNKSKAYSRISWDLLKKYSEGIICLSGDGNGYIPQIIMNDGDAKAAALKFHDIFGDDFALELQPNNLQIKSNPASGGVDQRKINLALKAIHDECPKVKCIVATGSYYIEREHHDSQDVLLAISSNQPVYSGQRLKFDKKDFYVKKEEEVRAYFGRHKKLWSQDFVDSMFKNIVEFVDSCEDPEWIDPKFSNPSGKELPEFPVADQDDYNEFIEWKSTYKDNHLADDVLYYRYVIQKGLDEKIALGKLLSEDLDKFNNQIDEELDVLEYHGFSSYMLIVWDMINWCKSKGIPTGPGRGCLTGDTEVLTSDGFVRLDSIEVGNEVYTHKGRLRRVTNKFSYDIEEYGLRIGSDYSFNKINLTKDHKVYASVCCEAAPNKPNWIKAGSLKNGDYIFMPFPVRDNIINWDGSDCFDLEKYDITISDWQKLDNTYVKSVDRFIKKDNEFLYILGRWIGDGWLGRTNQSGNNIGFAFNSDDLEGIDKIKKYFSSKGFDVSQFDSKDKKLSQIIINGKLLFNLFKDLISDYKCTSKTKHLPSFFRNLSNENIKSLLTGLCDSDGHVEISKDYQRENFDTTSKRLALEVKEALLYLKIPSSIKIRNEFEYGKYICSKSFKLRFKGLKLNKSLNNLINGNGYFCKITSIENVNLNKVYDISVEDDVSYVTSNYAVHNSVAGVFTAYLIDIHNVNPFKYGTIFSRFHNKKKTSWPDIDVDIAPSGRDKLHLYLRNKYGEEYVAHVSNINTITPKVYARDIARVFEFGDDGRTAAAAIGDDIADSISSEYSRVTTALAQAPLFQEYAKQYPELEKHAILGGKARAWSTHAAGLVIGKRPLHEIVPVRRDPHGALCLEYEKVRAEDNGLVKMDTLGLETLDIINKTYELITKNGKIPPTLPFDYDKYDGDEKTYEMISEGRVACVFQLAGVAAAVCKMVQPKSIKDIAMITSLIRPAAKAIIPDFMKVRFGERELELIHPNLERALKETNGFGLYEECLMYIAADIAGWDLHKADDLRKMTKDKGKYPEKVAALKEQFILDAQNNKNIDKEVATKIWTDIISDFGGYGFNLSLYFLESVDTYTSKGQFITAKPIKEVESGEYVRSRDEETKEDIYIEVIANHDHGELEVVEVELDSGEKVKCTMNHKFRTVETGEMLPLHEIVKHNLSIVLG